MAPLEELTEAYASACADENFQTELHELLRDYAGRQSCDRRRRIRSRVCDAFGDVTSEVSRTANIYRGAQAQSGSRPLVMLAPQSLFLTPD